ncbi:hypothetical protein [Streptomyces sp. NPDC020298]|uniref:hypothetical protein n=1 Tax=unclassified Streptomyces TaxID=2593676 RepID=UPI0033D2E416
MRSHTGKRAGLFLVSLVMTVSVGVAPAAWASSGPPVSVPGKSKPAPPPPKHCPWYKLWC